VIQNKKIQQGYFHAELLLRYGVAFKYPAVFEIRGSGSVLETTAIAFDITQKDKTKQLVEEKLIVPKVCKNLCRDDLLWYLADIVRKESNFVLYVSEKPHKYDHLRFYALTENQRLVFNEHMILAIIQLLDARKKTTPIQDN
jgi:hypothetical protein